MKITEYNPTEQSSFTYRPGQCVEIVLAGRPLGICFWSDDWTQLNPEQYYLFDTNGVVIEPFASMFTVLSRLLDVAISEWTDFSVQFQAAGAPTGICMDRLTKVFTDFSHPCAFVLPSPAEEESVITGDIIATGISSGRSHIGVRFGSAQRKKHTPEGVDPLQCFDPDLFYQADAALRDAIRPASVTWYSGFGFLNKPLWVLGHTLKTNYQMPFNSLPSFSNIKDLISTGKTETIDKIWHEDPVVDRVAKTRSASMTARLTAVLREIYKNNAFMLSPEAFRTLETWAGAVCNYLYAMPPAMYNQYRNEERVNSNPFFTFNAHAYSGVILAIDEKRGLDVGNMPVWEHELSGLPFWSVVIAIHSYTTVLQAVSHNKLLPDLVKKIHSQYGLEYIAWALAVGMLLRSAEFSQGNISLAECLDMPSILSGNLMSNPQCQDLFDFLQGDLLSDYRTLQLGMFWIYTNSQSSVFPAVDMAIRLFSSTPGNNQQQWLHSAIEKEHDVSAAMDNYRVMSIESVGEGWVSQIEASMHLHCSEASTYDTGSVRYKFTFPYIAVGQGNTEEILYTFLSAAFSIIDASTRLITASDCYMEYLLPAHLTLKTKEEFVSNNQGTNASSLSVAYRQMIKASDALDTFRHRDKYYRFIHNLAIRRFLPALWLNIGFRYETYLQDLCSRLFFICSPDTRDYVINLFNIALNHQIDLNSLKFSSSEFPNKVMEMKDLIIYFISVYTTKPQAGADDEFRLFNSWFAYIGDIRNGTFMDCSDPITIFIDAYQVHYFGHYGGEKELKIVKRLINYMRQNFGSKPWSLAGYLSGMNSSISLIDFHERMTWLLMIFMGL
ncbi:MAG TPA: hypothetical protein VFE04_03715, partial [Puia sp.]|nr:hypothetical protein [Puia sp.]